MITGLIVLLAVIYLWAGIGFFIVYRAGTFHEGRKGLHRQLLIILIWPYVVFAMATEVAPFLLGWLVRTDRRH